jgi:hypothetical protein
MKHQFVIECDTDKNFQDANGSKRLADHVAGRLWEMDGVTHGTAVAKMVPKDCVIISRAEYEQLMASAEHVNSYQVGLRSSS